MEIVAAAREHRGQREGDRIGWMGAIGVLVGEGGAGRAGILGPTCAEMTWRRVLQFVRRVGIFLVCAPLKI